MGLHHYYNRITHKYCLDLKTKKDYISTDHRWITMSVIIQKKVEYLFINKTSIKEVRLEFKINIFNRQIKTTHKYGRRERSESYSHWRLGISPPALSTHNFYDSTWRGLSDGRLRCWKDDQKLTYLKY